MVRLPVSSPRARGAGAPAPGSSIAGSAVGQGGERGDAARRGGLGGRGDGFAILVARARPGPRACRPGRGRARSPRRRSPRRRPGGREPAPRSAMRPSRTSRPPGQSRPEAGSSRRTLVKQRVRHCADRPRDSTSSTAMRTATPISTCSLITLRTGSSATALSISTPRFIGPGCITSASGLAWASLRGIQPVEAEELAGAGHQPARHPLALQPQHHHHVGAGEARCHVGERRDAEPRDLGRHQRRRADHAHPGAHRGQQVDVGAGDAASAARRRRSRPPGPPAGPCGGGW